MAKSKPNCKTNRLAPPTDEFFRGWETYLGKVNDCLRQLTPAQLELRASPRHRPLWRLPAHMLGARGSDALFPGK